MAPSGPPSSPSSSSAPSTGECADMTSMKPLAAGSWTSSAAGADMSFIYRAYSVGAVDYLTKPIDPDVVRAKVAIFAEMHRKDMQILRQAEALREADRRQKEHELAELRRASQARYRNLADAV